MGATTGKGDKHSFVGPAEACSSDACSEEQDHGAQPMEPYLLGPSHGVGMLAHQAILHSRGLPCWLHGRKADHALDFHRFSQEREQHNSWALGHGW